MFYKNNGPEKFKKLLKSAIEKLFKILKLAGVAAINAFLFLGQTAAAAAATVWGWLVGLIGAGLAAIVKKVVSKEKEEDIDEKESDNDSKSSLD